MSGAKRERLFIALWPGGEEREQLHSLQKSILGQANCRRIPAQNFHLTLFFLGSVPASDTQRLRRALREIRVERFCLSLAKTVYRRRQRILWLEADLPESMQLLLEQVKRVVSQHKFPVDDRPPSAHITLARKLEKFSSSSQEIDPVRWCINDWVLVRSTTFPEGAVYEILERYPLN